MSDVEASSALSKGIFEFISGNPDHIAMIYNDEIVVCEKVKNETCKIASLLRKNGARAGDSVVLDIDERNVAAMAACLFLGVKFFVTNFAEDFPDKFVESLGPRLVLSRRDWEYHPTFRLLKIDDSDEEDLEELSFADVSSCDPVFVALESLSFREFTSEDILGFQMDENDLFLSTVLSTFDPGDALSIILALRSLLIPTTRIVEQPMTIESLNYLVDQHHIDVLHLRAADAIELVNEDLLFEELTPVNLVLIPDFKVNEETLSALQSKVPNAKIVQTLQYPHKILSSGTELCLRTIKCWVEELPQVERAIAMDIPHWFQNALPVIVVQQRKDTVISEDDVAKLVSIKLNRPFKGFITFVSEFPRDEQTGGVDEAKVRESVCDVLDT